MTLPLPDSLWAATANPCPEHTQLRGDITADVAIVGAGFTGLRAALELSQQGVSVVVVDAGQIGWGASGRNGGQVNPIGHESPVATEKKWSKLYGAQRGKELANRFSQMYVNAADELFDLVKTHNIQCDAEQNGWIRSVHGPAAEADFHDMFKGWHDAGADIEMLDATQVEQMSGCKGYGLGWIAKRGGTVQPMSYVRGLADAALKAGASIHCDTRIDTLEQHNGKWKLTSPTGSITADQVLLCTNGYSDSLYPNLAKSVVPVISIQAATQVLTDEQSAEILPGRQTFADTRRVIYYFKKTAENRLVFGSAGITAESPSTSDHERIMQGLRTVYPQFPELKVDYIWGGRIAVTLDHLPHIHQPAQGLHIGLGYNGRGVAMSTVMGRLLAETAMGKPADDLPLPVSEIKNYPFHRFHRTGIRLLVPFKEYCDRREAQSQ